MVVRNPRTRGQRVGGRSKFKEGRSGSTAESERGAGSRCPPLASSADRQSASAPTAARPVAVEDCPKTEGDTHPGAARTPSGPPAHSALIACVNAVIVFFASPSTSIVFGRTKSPFSMPAKPAFSERLSTMQERAASAASTGMP